MISKYRGRDFSWYLMIPVMVGRLFNHYVVRIGLAKLYRKCSGFLYKIAERRAVQPLDLSHARRILWIRVNGIGDVVMGLPALAALHARYPDAEIDLLIRPISEPIVRDLPFICNIYCFEPSSATPSTRSNFSRKQNKETIRQLQANAYDVAIDIAGLNDGRYLAWQSSAHWTISPVASGYRHAEAFDWPLLATHPVNVQQNPDGGTMNMLAVVGALDAKPLSEPFRLPIGCQNRRTVKEKLDQHGVRPSYAVLHARPSSKHREWRMEGWIETANHLVSQHGLDVILTGAHPDLAYNHEIKRRSQYPERLHNTSGEFDLTDLPALFEKCAVMVTVDTGPMHIATMVGTPIVSLHLPGFIRFAPYNQTGGAIFHPDDTNGLIHITTASVIEAVDKKLRASVPAGR